MVFAQERKINLCVGQVADEEVFISCDGDAGYSVKAGATAEVRLSNEQEVDEMILLIRDSFIPAFVGLEKTLRSKLEEVKNDWE